MKPLPLSSSFLIPPGRKSLGYWQDEHTVYVEAIVPARSDRR
jgi:hypothetical protein